MMNRYRSSSLSSLGRGWISAPLLRARSRFTLVFAGALVWSALLAGVQGAEPAKKRFDLAADAAERALKQFSVQSGLEVLFATEATAGVRTQAVYGDYVPLEAANRMLAGTGLVATQDRGNSAIVIAKQNPASANPRNSPAAASPESFAPGASVDPSESRDGVVALSIFEVTGERDEGYRSTQTLSGTRTLENLRDTPNSISVINRELIDDLIATTVAELSEYSITGEVGTNTESIATAGGYVFRGITSNIQLRNGVTLFLPVDTFSLERVEVLRGPTAFLYGEGSPGGLMNQVTKLAGPRNFERVNLLYGSDNLHRIELDINRRINDQLAVRAALAYHDAESFQNHARRNFRALYFTVNYRPFRYTNINANFELGRNHTVMRANMLADQFSNTQRTGATTPYTVTTGGYTLVPATGQIYRTVGLLRSTGTNLVVADENILSREMNFRGPNAFNQQHYDALNVSLDQRIFENFNIQASATFQTVHRNVRSTGGSSQAAIYVDRNLTLPDGSPNPYYNEYYTEYYVNIFKHSEPIRNWRATAVYDLKLPFTTQRIVGTGVYHDSCPDNRYFAEFVDPATPYFDGTFINANTLAAYQANTTTMGRNFFYRRFYLKDGDGARITNDGAIPGRSAIIRNTVSDGTAGRLTNRRYRAPGYGFGASGSYLGGRLRSLVGWRHDSFIQDPERDFHNYVTGERYQLDSTAPVRTRIHQESHNYGAVAHFFDFVSGYFNYAQSVALSSGVGGAGLRPGTVRGPSLGDGYEYGLRWSFWEGRLESNWTYYITSALNVAANPAVPVAVRQTELGGLFDDINPGGADTQATKASGVEFETVANLTKEWRLTWNFSTNDLETSQRYPALHYYQARAREAGQPTPDTDAFLASVPNGTPLPGFTKIRSNLITNYRFSSGPLRGVSLGGGFQYRDTSYQGNFDLNRDGVAEELWTPGYFLWNAMLGYRTRILDRSVTLSLNINNLLDKSYYRAYSLSAGGWGEGRSFRFAARIDL